MLNQSINQLKNPPPPRPRFILVANNKSPDTGKLDEQTCLFVLADRTNGPAYASVASVCRRLWRYALW